MVRDDLRLAVCACTLVGALAGASAAQAPVMNDDRSRAVSEKLAVQIAMQQARNHLLANQPGEAVKVLEAHIARIDGNRYYLILLRDAYRAYVRELTLTNQTERAQLYAQRLKILDPDNKADVAPPKEVAAAPTPARPGPQPLPQPPPVITEVSGTRAPVVPAVRSEPAPPENDPLAPTFRGKGLDEVDPFQQEPENLKAAQNFLAQADKAFSAKRYGEAAALYEEAHRQTPRLPEASRERWAYCKLHHVVEQLNHTTAHDPPYPELEAEVKLAMQLAPRILYAQTLLGEIEKLRKRKPSEVIVVKHLNRRPDGWEVAETENFRILHNQPRQLAEDAARMAERTRRRMQKKWFGNIGPVWDPRCEIYLHATAEDYSKATAVPAGSPGHSSFTIDGGRVIGRRIDLHCDHPNLLTAILPHETTHTVLAGNFGSKPLPRWADEGMAVLTEPEEQIDRHRRKLPNHHRQGNLFTVQHLIELGDYPDARDVDVFYAQSVSLVEYLTKQKGPRIFADFIRDGMKQGFEPALQKHFGYRSYIDLQERWLDHTFPRTANR
ncbi:MAG: hypothetical protein AB7K24_08860 [Gemmataceae bacterium]